MNTTAVRSRRRIAILTFYLLVIALLVATQGIARPQVARASTSPVPANDMVVTDTAYTDGLALLKPDGTVSDLGLDTTGDEFPAVLTGGGKVAYDTEGSGSTDTNGLYVTDMTTGTDTQVTSDSNTLCSPNNCEYAQPSWNPSGTDLVFQLYYSTSSGLVYDIATVDNSTGDISTLVNDGVSGTWVQSPAWSPDGSTIAYSYCESNGCDIETIPSDGGTPTEIAVGIGSDEYYADPAWSPDGSKIYFDDGFNVFSASNSEDSTPDQLTTDNESYVPTVWADGHLVSYVDNGNIYTMNADGSNKTARTSGGGLNYPSYSMPTPISSSSNLPEWWDDTVCDTHNYAASSPLGASYAGVQACGPGPDQGGSDHSITFTGGGSGQFEWECVELSMRFMKLAYGVTPYYLPDNAASIVSAYSGSAMTAVSNDATGYSGLPQPGDIFAESANAGNGEDGHTGVITAVNVNSSGDGEVWIMEQNVSGSGDADGWNTISVSDWILGSDVTGWLAPS